MGSVISEEQAISQAQYLDLVYSHSGTLYDLIPQSPRPSTDPAKPPVETPVDGIFGSIQSPSTTKPAKQPQTSTPTPSTPKVSAEVNSIQSIQMLGNNKKKGKAKNKRHRNQPPMITIKGKENKNIHVCYAEVTISQKSVPVGTKSPNF